MYYPDIENVLSNFSSLNKREKRILLLRYPALLFENEKRRTYTEIGREFNISANRVCQIYSVSIFKLLQSPPLKVGEIECTSRIIHLPIISTRTLHCLLGERIETYSDLVLSFKSGKLDNASGFGEVARREVELLIRKTS